MRLKRTALMLLIAAGATGLLATAAHAQWKWKDSNGQVHASDLPPPREVPEKDVIQRPAAAAKRAAQANAAPALVAASAASAAIGAASAASAAGAGKARTDPELEARRRANEQAEKAKAKAEEDRMAALRAENCQRARQALSRLDSGQRIARTNDKGETEILDDKGRAQESQAARQVVSTDCK